LLDETQFPTEDFLDIYRRGSWSKQF